MSASLLVDGLGNWVINYQLKKDRENRLGRTADNDVTIPGAQVSSRHTVIYHAGGKWTLKDVSKNGTYLNNEKVTERVLRTGDSIRIGQTVIQFRDPEEKGGEAEGLTVWGSTVQKFARQSERLKGQIEDGSVSSAIELPEAIVDDKNSASGAAFRQPLSPLAKTDSTEDRVWVAERLAELLAEVATNGEREKVDTFELILGRLSDYINAENGFLMVANGETNRWEIRAWVGSIDQWSNYEKEHPVPLSVANKAFVDKTTVAMVPDLSAPQGDGQSLLALQVKTYMAIPLIKDAKSWGVIYFDNRLGVAPFRKRDVQLLERVAPFLGQIEFQK